MTFYFYDLETSSGSPRSGRIMQFAGQRTDEELQPIGEPDNILVKLADDILPEPDAILVHGITPQKTLEEGLTEAEFARFFQEKIALADTTFVGFNNIRFDDEFMRRVFYRTFYDPYQWHWRDGRSRWDLLDPIRMMRALRPEGLNWPDVDGKPTVRLELMAKANGFNHTKAHDALSDVEALIQLTQKFKSAQPKLFGYLLETKDKKKVAELALAGAPFVYTSGKYPSEHEKTTLVMPLMKHPRREAAIVYNLRHDPTPWFDKSIDELIAHWTVRYGDELEPLPVKTLQFNRCPAVAPAGVLDVHSLERIQLDLEQALAHQKLLATHPEFVEKLAETLDRLENEQQASLPLGDSVDDQLYDGFWGTADQSDLQKVRSSSPEQLAALESEIRNRRIREMIPLYRARNFPKTLSVEEREAWEARRQKIFYNGEDKSMYAKFSKRMQEIAQLRKLSPQEEYLLTELQLYVESILPEPADI